MNDTSENISENNKIYPLLKEYYSFDTIIKLFGEVRGDGNVKVTVFNYDGKHNYNKKKIKFHVLNFKSHALIHEYFTESIRVNNKCKNIDDTENNLFKKNYDKYTSCLAQNKSVPISKSCVTNLLDCKYDILSVDLIYKLCRFYKPMDILDCCSKYGEGLISFMAYATRSYTSVCPRYSELDTMILKLKKNITGINFVDKIDPSHKFDMILSENVNDINYLGDHGHAFIFSQNCDIPKIPNLSFEGVIEYTVNDTIFNNIFVFYKKPAVVLEEIYNPIPIIRDEETDGRIFHIIRDDYLPGGTKQRGGVPYLMDIVKNKPDITEFFYKGPSNGVAQVAIAVIAKMLGYKSTVLIHEKKEPNDYSYLTISAILWGCNIISYDKRKNYTFKIVDAENKPKPGRLIIPLGFNTEEFRKHLSTSILKSFSNIKVKELWLASTTGNLLRPFYNVFPDAHFNAVLPGYKDRDYINSKNTSVYEAPEDYYDNAQVPPPYNSALDYDAKIWRFVAKYGKNGDYVLNVA